MRPIFLLTSIIALLLFSVSAFPALIDENLAGKVIIRNPEKLDRKTKTELASIAAKIGKIKQKGVVRVVGDATSASSQEEYLLKSAFVARAVVTYLKSIIPGKYQIYIAPSLYGAQSKPVENSVEIYFYPHDLKAASIGLIPIRIDTERIPVELKAIQEVQPAPYSEGGGLLTPPLEDENYADVPSIKAREQEDSENAALANELVNKAKARAAEKAKRLEKQY